MESQELLETEIDDLLNHLKDYCPFSDNVERMLKHHRLPMSMIEKFVKEYELWKVRRFLGT